MRPAEAFNHPEQAVGPDGAPDLSAGEPAQRDRDFSKLKGDLRSLMELHMNITSFETNKFMKLLAIVGFLGLIPSVAAGLLGMSVSGTPWSVTLGQVAFGIAMGMTISLYVFAIKGWLR